VQTWMRMPGTHTTGSSQSESSSPNFLQRNNPLEVQVRNKIWNRGKGRTDCVVWIIPNMFSRATYTVRCWKSQAKPSEDGATAQNWGIEDNWDPAEPSLVHFAKDGKNLDDNFFPSLK
jgi:hypothetical protein